MSYEINTDKLITIANLRNFYDRFWDEMDEEHNIMMEAFMPGGNACASEADVDEACFSIYSYQEECPENEYGQHIWIDKGSGVWECRNCGAVLEEKENGTFDPCPKGEHNYVEVVSGNHWVCSVCGNAINDSSFLNT